MVVNLFVVAQVAIVAVPVGTITVPVAETTVDPPSGIMLVIFFSNREGWNI